ncbi:MAG: AAA family ATPase [Terriglobia bacterium]|jgi:predicted ATPase
MFDYIKIEGFRSFKSVELKLGPLSVLIGPNNGGKSNFVDLLMLLADAGNGQLSKGVLNKRGGFRDIAFGFDPSGDVRMEMVFKEALHRWKVALPVEGRDRKLDVRFKMVLRSFGSGAQVTEELVRQESATQPSLSGDMVTRGPQGAVFRMSSESGALTDQRTGVAPMELVISHVKDPDKYPAASAVLREVGGWAFYRDIDVGPESPIRQAAMIRSGFQLLPDGSNLSSVFHAIQQEHPDDWRDILELFETAYPDFLKLTLPADLADGRVILRWWEKPFEKQGGLAANILSDGTLKLMCLVAILKNPRPPSLICIDEPELGLHPDWIKLVAELLQEAACRTQVIVATHSPHIVAKLDPDQVIVVDKIDGESKMKRLEKADLEKWLKDFNLSELWLAGHFGGRP